VSKIDYPLDGLRAVVFDIDGVLSPSTVPMGDDGVPRRMVNIKDGYAMQLAVRSGLQLAIISGGRGAGLRERYEALGVKDVFLGSGEKIVVLKEWMAARGLKPEEVAFVGDDIPDLPAMRHVGLAVAPRDGAHEVRAVARYVTRADGGYGVARELLEEILRVRGAWLDSATAFGW